MRRSARLRTTCATALLPDHAPHIATVTGLLSVFFVFWFVRLIVVTGVPQHLGPGGGGAYMGPVVFPWLAIAFGWVMTRLWRRAE